MIMMPNSMTSMVGFFHESDHFARARELREALDQFETRMPERIEGRMMSRLPTETRAPNGWSRFRRFPTPREAGFYGLGWERHRPDSEELTDWVGFGWWCLSKHDYLLDPRDDPATPCRWIGWWRPGTEHLSAEEQRLFDEIRAGLGDGFDGLLDPSLFDREPQHDDGWPYYHGMPAAEVGALRVDTDEFATALSKLLPLIRRAVEQIG
jgi:hypothetical protein